MFDLKKATKEELLDVLTERAQIVEDYVRLYSETAQGKVYKKLRPFTVFAEGSLFTSAPLREMQIESNFWERLAEALDPEIKYEDAVSRDSVYSYREFTIDLCGHKYQIFNLYIEED